LVDAADTKVGAAINHPEVVQPAVLALLELGNGVGGIKVSSVDRATTRQNIRDAFLASKARYNAKR
jgi:hypothetical protein